MVKVKEFDKLVEDIENYCVCGGGYCEPFIKAFVTCFALKHNIWADTFVWDSLVSYLWEKLPIHDNWETINDFDLYIGGEIS